MVKTKIVIRFWGRSKVSFVQAKCTNCGGILAVDDSLEAAVCPFCNTPYVVEKAIHNYYITNNISVGSGANVNIYGAAEKDFEIVGGELKAYKGESVDVVIPNTVKRIADKAFTHFEGGWFSNTRFEGMHIESLVIPESVTYIGSRAFEGCKQLKSITFQGGNTDIGALAFAECKSLSELILPAGICVGPNAFHQCTQLKCITVQDPVGGENRNTILGEQAFSDCYSLVNINFGNGPIDIGNEAFRNCTSLVELIIPQQVTYLGSYCFCDCMALKNVTVYSDNICIFQYAFSHCPSLDSFTLYSSNPQLYHFSLDSYWHNKGFCRRCGGSLRSLTKKCSRCGYKDAK